MVSQNRIDVKKKTPKENENSLGFGIDIIMGTWYCIVIKDTTGERNMNLAEIQTAVREGKTVCWGTDNYEVIVDNIPQWLIHSKCNDHYWGLTHQDGITMNGAERDFYLKDERRYLFIATACQREVKAWVNSPDEKTGRRAFWDSLTDAERNRTECIEMVDIRYGEDPNPQPPCHCGNPKAYWECIDSGLRTYQCEDCHEKQKGGTK